MASSLDKLHYMVVQPTRASCVLAMEAKTMGAPPLSEPYSSVKVEVTGEMFAISSAYLLLSRETFDQGNCVNSLNEPDGARCRGFEPSMPTFHSPFCLR